MALGFSPNAGPRHSTAPPLVLKHPSRRSFGISLDVTAAAEEPPIMELISYDSMADEFRIQIDGAFKVRNKERILSGLPKYESINAMVTAYQEFEANEKGMSRAEAEDEVLRYLQRKALMDEGGFDGDPQTVLTFVLLALLVGGALRPVPALYDLECSLSMVCLLRRGDVRVLHGRGCFLAVAPGAWSRHVGQRASSMGARMPAPMRNALLMQLLVSVRLLI